MRVHVSKPLFAWDCLEDSPTLRTIREFLEAIPDRKLLDALEQARGKGRDDYPIRTCWGTLLVTILLRHLSVEACLAELSRNPALRLLIGIESEDQVPSKWSMSRFLESLGAPAILPLLKEVFDQMVRRLGEVVEDLGVHTAGDASGLHARCDRKKTQRKGPDPLPPPTGGRKEYTDEEGNVTHVVEWFGYKFHLLVDTKHELAVAYGITSANVGDNEALPDLLEEAQSNLPQGRMKTLAYDKACDAQEVHEVLDEAEIAAIIENRTLWKEEHERMLPGHDGTSNVVYDEAGTVYCYDKVSDPPVRHKMAYIGHEPARGTLKYRCPAMHQGWSCPSHKRCNAGKTYGKTVRVKREIDARRFPAVPRATKQFERRYKGRTAVERVNSRLKVFWGADDGNITGARRFHAYLGVVMVVHIGLGTLLARNERWEGTLSKISLSPIAKALCESTQD
jgi:hypothetical protein